MSHRINLLAPRSSWAQRLAQMDRALQEAPRGDTSDLLPPIDDASRLELQRCLVTNRLLLAAIRDGADKITLINRDDDWQAAFVVRGRTRPIDLRRFATHTIATEADPDPAMADIPEWALGRSISLRLHELAGINPRKGQRQGRFGLLLTTHPRQEVRFDVSSVRADDEERLQLLLSETVDDER